MPFKWTLITASHSSSVILTSMRSRRIPALFTKTSSFPKVLMAWSIMFFAPSKLLTSSPFTIASPPIAVISSATAWAGDGSDPTPFTVPPRSLTTIFAPALASWRACCRPSPRAAPVTTATRPSHNLAIRYPF